MTISLDKKRVITKIYKFNLIIQKQENNRSDEIGKTLPQL